jgi:SEC-C motif-containing protein
MNRYAPCPCKSNLTYQQCCRRYHQGENPATAEVLMRSRYCAYALNLPKYVMETTHPKNDDYQENTAAWKETIQTFSKNTQFQSLEILDHKETGTTATVTFKANMMDGLQDATVTEKSTFEKVDGRWLYLSGEILEDAQAPKEVTA